MNKRKKYILWSSFHSRGRVRIFLKTPFGFGVQVQTRILTRKKWRTRFGPTLILSGYFFSRGQYPSNIAPIPPWSNMPCASCFSNSFFYSSVKVEPKGHRRTYLTGSQGMRWAGEPSLPIGSRARPPPPPARSPLPFAARKRLSLPPFTTPQLNTPRDRCQGW